MPAHPPILLVVEDDESSRVMYSEYLSHAGYWVLQAPTAADGLKSAHRFGPDIVVTDICLPGMDGWQFAEALKRDRRTSRTQIIAITGRALDDGLEKQARQAGIESLLIKPCLPDELLAEIERLLAHGRSIRQSANQRLSRARALREKSNGLIEVSHRLQRRRRG